MTSVIAALIAGNNICILRKQIDHTTFSSSPQLIPVTAVSIFYPPSIDTVFEHKPMHNLL